MNAAGYLSVEQLRNGTPVTIRAIRADDKARVVRAFHALEPDSIYTVTVPFALPKSGATAEADLQWKFGRKQVAPGTTQEYEPLGPEGARIIAPAEEEYGVQKTMELRLAAKGTRVDVTLRVTNVGKSPTQLAPWGPTVMAPGGMEIIPLPPKAPHPGHPKNAKSPADFR